MPKPVNKIVINRKSSNIEPDYIQAYVKQNPSAKKKDGLDIAAVRDKDGTPGHALMNPEHNRSKDKNPHRGQDFIPDSQLKKDINKK
jgi:hypothetical protein